MTHAAQSDRAAPARAGASRVAQRWMLAVLGAAAAALGVLLWHTSGAVPRADEWATPGIFLVERAEGRATFDLLFRQHNESRVIFAQLLTGLLAELWGWNQHVLHGLNWLLTVLTALLFVRLVSATLADGARERRLGWPVILALCSAVALIFSPVQWRNFLSSGQIITIAIPCLLLTGITVDRKLALPVPIRYGVAAACALLASFSFVNGLMLWFLLWPAPFVMAHNRSLRLRRAEVLASILYFAATAAVIAIYFHGYSSPPGHPPMSHGLRVPHLALFFALTWLAGPLWPEPMYYWQDPSANWVPFILCGSLAAMAGLVLAVWIVVNHRRMLPTRAPAPVPRDVAFRLLPFVPLLAYSLLSAAAIALARIGFGTAFGNTSRYTTVAVPGYLALAGMLAVVTKDLTGLRAKTVLASFALLFATAVLTSSAVGGMQSRLDRGVARLAAVSLDFRDVVPADPLLTSLYQSADLGDNSKRADDLERLGLLPRRASLAWVLEQPPTPRSDLSHDIRLVDESWAYWRVTGRVWPATALEEDDVLLLRDKESARPLTVFLAPAGSNYPGKPDGVFELRYMKALAAPLAVENTEMLLVRRRTREVWRL